MHFYGWKKGLKTGMYYLRSQPAADAIQFTVDQQKLEQAKSLQDKTGSTSPKKRKKPTSYNNEELLFPTRKLLFRTCNMNDDEGCLMCSS